MNKLFLLIFLAFLSCKSVREYNSITVYDPIDNSDDCMYSTLEAEGNIVYNTSFNYIKASVFGEDKKFKIEFFVYGYRPFTFWKKRKDSISITVFCENGYKFYIEFGHFCILTLPDDGDEDYCDDRIFYSL
jgi:hypothetical protein